MMRGPYIVAAAASVACTTAALATSGGPAVGDAAPRVDAAKQLLTEKNWKVLQALYPKRALARGEEGLVGFLIRIDGEGNPRECRVTHTSGYPLLDRDTCRLVLIHATGYKAPRGLKRWESLEVEGVVNWKLPTTVRSKAFAPPELIARAAAPEKLVCRRYLVTGSTVDMETVCQPPSEWYKAWDDQQTWWRQQLTKGGGGSEEGPASGSSGK